MNIVSPLLKKILDAKIQKANVECHEVFHAYHDKYPTRSFAISVIDKGQHEILGFGLDKGQLMGTSRIHNPTIKMTVSLRVFKALLAGKISDNQLYYERYAEFEGEHIWKHKVILSEMIKSFRKVGLLKDPSEPNILGQK